MKRSILMKKDEVEGNKFLFDIIKSFDKPLRVDDEIDAIRIWFENEDDYITFVNSYKSIVELRSLIMGHLEDRREMLEQIKLEKRVLVYGFALN